ncbi:hypothetical protein B0H13DRAFT_1882006 [Mycena leptocephala]|nr:hypothetical protein B0H13DRAFT_1882006 [Mycena leptocephala]
MCFDLPLEVEEGGVVLESFEDFWPNSVDFEPEADDLPELDAPRPLLDQPFGPELALMLGMEGGSTREILKDNLDPMPTYNVDMGASVSTAELLEKGEKRKAQPHVDPVDPSPLVPASAEPDSVVCANDEFLKDHGQTNLGCLNWATQLLGVLSKINSGLECPLQLCSTTAFPNMRHSASVVKIWFNTVHSIPSLAHIPQILSDPKMLEGLSRAIANFWEI